jgi:hypothetical protein
MIRHYIFLLFLSSSTIVAAQGEKSIDSLIGSKVYSGSNIPLIRRSAGYPSGKDGMSFYPDSSSNQLALVTIYKPSYSFNIRRIDFHFHHDELIKVSIDDKDAKTMKVYYFIKGKVLTNDSTFTNGLSREILISKAKGYRDYYYLSIK